MTINSNGIGQSITKALTGTAISVRWTPSLEVKVDGVPVPGVLAVELYPAGVNGTVQHLVMVFQGSNASPRNALVTRQVSTVVAAPTNDGFTATMTALA